jgi:hypothetical protein
LSRGGRIEEAEQVGPTVIGFERKDDELDTLKRGETLLDWWRMFLKMGLEAPRSMMREKP